MYAAEERTGGVLSWSVRTLSWLPPWRPVAAAACQQAGAGTCSKDGLGWAEAVPALQSLLLPWRGLPAVAGPGSQLTVYARTGWPARPVEHHVLLLVERSPGSAAATSCYCRALTL